MQSMKSRGPSNELCSTPQGVLTLLKIYEINHIWTTEMKWKWRNDRRSEPNLCNCVKKPEKNSDFNGVWSRDLAITGAMLYQLSYEANDVRSRSIVGSYVPVKEIWTHNYPAPNVSGFIAQLVEHPPVIARSRVQTPLKSWIFFRLLYAIA